MILWLRLEAPPERALGPGATVSNLGMGVPRLACLRPTAWLGWQVYTAHPHRQGIQDPREGPSLARRTMQDLLRSGLVGQAREERRYQGGKTSRGYHDVSHDDRCQAGASARSVLVSSLVLRRPAQVRSTEASGKGCHIVATRPGPDGRRDGGHHGAQDSATTRAFGR